MTGASARDEVLARIAAAHRHAPPAPGTAYDQVRRDYRTGGGPMGAELLDLLVDRLVDYRARVRRTTADGLAGEVAAALAASGLRRVVVPPGLDPGELGLTGDLEVLRDDPSAPLLVADLDGADVVLTGCAVAIAETGTLVLDAAPDQGRRALTLVPDHHVCVVRADQVVASVPEALTRLDPTRPLTFVSGPSATSDIELDRVEGVHGPRTLEVVVVEEPWISRAG